MAQVSQSSIPSASAKSPELPTASQRDAPQPDSGLLAGSRANRRRRHYWPVSQPVTFLSDKGTNPDGWVYKSEQEMGKETVLTKREQQTARRKLLSLGVIAIMRGGFRNTYHCKVIWQKLHQVIAGIQRQQFVPTEKDERVQNIPTEPEQNVSTEPAQCLQKVSIKWKQNGATHNRENNTENKEREKTNRENQTIWENAREQIKKDLPLGETADRLNGTAPIAVTDTAALIGVPNRFAVPWFERRLYGQIAKAMKAVVGKDVDSGDCV
jgi:hypothetical protein